MSIFSSQQCSKYILTLLVFLFACSCLNAQSPVFWNYNAEKGLPSSETYYAMQDSKGYVWIATSNGVCYYDGYTFRSLNMDNGLPDNTVFEIYEDYKQRIWFVSFSGKLSYFENDSIYEFAFNERMLKSFTMSPIYCKRSFRVDEQDNVKINFFDMPPLSISKDGEIQKGGIQQNAEVYIYKEENIALYNSLFDPKKRNDRDKIIFNVSGNIVEVKISDKNFYAKKVLSLAHNKFASICFTFGNYLIEFENSKLKNTRYFEKDLLFIDYDKEGNLWVCERGRGVYCFEKGRINTEPSKHYLEGNSITSILFDNENGIWFSTLENGIYYFLNNNVVSYTKKEGLMYDQINTLSYSGDTLWMGGKNNYYYSLQSNRIQKYYIKHPFDIDIIKIYFDSISDYLFVSTGYSCFSVPRAKINLSGTIPLNRIIIDAVTKDMVSDNEKNVWCATIASAIKLRGNKQIYNSMEGDAFGRRLNSCCMGNNKDVWLGGNLGLYVGRKNPEKPDSYQYTDMGDSLPIFKNRINAIRKSEFDGRIWIGTKGKGIIVWDDGKILQINRNNGLLSNNISSLFITSQSVWVGTDKGLNQIILNGNESDEYSIKAYTVSDGLASNEISDVCFLNGKVYLASKYGLTVCNPKEIKANKVPPRIYFTSVTILNKDTLLLNNYRLPYYKNHITIHYTGISFKSLGNITYRYRFIHDGDTTEKWNITTNRQITFPYLPSGDYQFQVYAINKDNISSVFPATLNFSIDSPFWKKWWFYTAIIVFILCIIILFFLYRLKNIKRQNVLSQKANSYLLLALSRQMNPHFIYNSLNSIQNYILKNDRILASEYLSKFASLMRSILHNSGHNVITIKEELDALVKYMDLESMRFANKFKYSIEIDPKIDPVKCTIPPLLLQPFIENSILHGLLPKEGGGEIKIKIEKQADNIYCSIEDDGIGRKKSAEVKKQSPGHKSLGIQISQNRINLINSLQNSSYNIEYVDLIDKETGEALGTRVIIIW